MTDQVVGYLVFGRHSNFPNGYWYEPVSAVFNLHPNGLEQAQNVRDSRNARRDDFDRDPILGVEYVIGEITVKDD